MFNVNSLNFQINKVSPNKDSFKQSDQFTRKNTTTPSENKLTKPDEKDEVVFTSTTSPMIHHQNNKSVSSNFLLKDNSFKREKGFDVSNLNFKSISKKLDDSNFKSATDRSFFNNRTNESKSNSFTPRNISLTPRNVKTRGLMKNSFVFTGDLYEINEKYGKNDFSLGHKVQDVSDENIQMTITKNLERELREKIDEIKVLKRNFIEKINHLEAENKKILENVNQQNKFNEENLSKNYDNLKVELNYQIGQLKLQYEETLNKMISDLKMSKHNNISIHLYNTKLSEISTKFNENLMRLKSSYENSLSEVFHLFERNDYKELMERIKFFDKYKDSLKFRLPKDFEKSKLNLTSEEALNDIIKLKLVEVEATHLRDYSKMQINYEKMINEHSDKNKEKLEKIKEIAIKRFSEIENISIFTKDYFVNREESGKKTSNLSEMRFNMNKNANLRSGMKVEIDINSSKDSLKFNSNMMKSSALPDKLNNFAKNEVEIVESDLRNVKPQHEENIKDKFEFKRFDEKKSERESRYENKKPTYSRPNNRHHSPSRSNSVSRSNDRNYEESEKNYEESNRYELNAKNGPMDFKRSQEYSVQLRNPESNSEYELKSKNTVLSIELENFEIDDDIHVLRPSTLYRTHKISDYPKDDQSSQS